ncbi:hypothetical protein HanLR1_Chr02g0071161 [Helianthus annuus]|nr:hypothetical protein HanLR1_Chr02g0071161 [Helianthus annuus]
MLSSPFPILLYVCFTLSQSKKQANTIYTHNIYTSHPHTPTKIILLSSILTIMATPPHILYLIPLILVVFFSSSHARTIPSSISSFHHSKTLKKTGHQLIKDLNLHPHLDINIVKSYNHSSYLDQELKVTQSGIVEKRLSLSVLGNSGASVHDLAQHAGYYRIEHTVDARYVFVS